MTKQQVRAVTDDASDAMAHGIPVVGTPAESAELRAMLTRLGLSQRAAARELEVGYREMRYWCAGRYKAPRCVTLALERLIDTRFTGNPISHTEWCAWTQTRGRGACTCGGRM